MTGRIAPVGRLRRPSASLAVAATDNALLAPELAAGIAHVKSAKSIGVRAGNWLSLKQALLNAPDITTTKGLHDRAIIALTLKNANIARKLKQFRPQ